MDVQITQTLPDHTVIAPDATFTTGHDMFVSLPDGQRVWGRVTDMYASDDGTELVMTVDVPCEAIPGFTAREISIGWKSP